MQRRNVFQQLVVSIHCLKHHQEGPFVIIHYNAIIRDILIFAIFLNQYKSTD